VQVPRGVANPEHSAYDCFNMRSAAASLFNDSCNKSLHPLYAVHEPGGVTTAQASYNFLDNLQQRASIHNRGFRLI